MRTLSLMLVAALTIGCVRTATNEATGEVDLDVESPTKQGEDWSGELVGMGAYATITGKHTALVNDGKTEVRVQFSGGTPNRTHPWHIHEGTCGSGGPIVGDPGAYPPITVSDAGTAAANATLFTQLDEAKDYYVNVHESTWDLATIIACGDLDD